MLSPSFQIWAPCINTMEGRGLPKACWPQVGHVRDKAADAADNPQPSGTYSTIYFPSHDVAVEGGLELGSESGSSLIGRTDPGQRADPTQSAGAPWQGGAGQRCPGSLSCHPENHATPIHSPLGIARQLVGRESLSCHAERRERWRDRARLHTRQQMSLSPNGTWHFWSHSLCPFPLNSAAALLFLVKRKSLNIMYFSLSFKS